MLRTGASRSAFRALNAFGTTSSRTSFKATQFSSKLSTLGASRPQALAKPMVLSLARYATKPMDNIDSKHEQQLAKEKLEADPNTVSTTSSTHPLFGEVGTEEQEKDADMMAGVRQDLVSGLMCLSCS